VSAPEVRLPASALRDRAAGLRLGSQTAFWVVVVDLILIGVFGVLSAEHSFLTVGNMQNLLLSVSQILVLAGGAAIVLGAGQFDISIGANLVLSSVVSARVLVWVSGATAAGEITRSSVLVASLLAVFAAVGTGALVGAVNGLVITRLRVNSFIATLAMLGIATGLAALISPGGDISNIPGELQADFGLRTFFEVPAVFWVVLLLIGLLWRVMRRTRFGLHTVAIGSSSSAAARAGIDVRRHIVLVFLVVGMFAGFAGFLDLTRLSTTNLGGHNIDALSAIAGVVIGGTALFGGIVSIPGAVAGTFLTVILQLGLVSVGLGAFYQQIAVGVFLIAAVAIDEARRHRTSR